MTGSQRKPYWRILERREMPPAQLEPLIPHKVHPGSRPSTIVLFQEARSRNLG